MRHPNNTPPTEPLQSQTTNRRRWWRIVLLSAVIQGLLLLIAWHTVQTRRHNERSASNEHIAVTAIQSEPAANQISNQAESVPHSTSDNSASDDTTPRSTIKHPQKTDDVGAQVVRPHDKNTTSKPSSTAATPSEPRNPKITNHATQNTTATLSEATKANDHSAPTNRPLLHVPIAAQSISYRVQLTDGSNTVELPPARWVSTHLGAQRYSVRLSNATAQAGAGNFGWFSTFLMTEHGAHPLDIGGGLYLKSGESPVRLALGLGLHDDGQTWHWGKKANSGTRTHTYFLDRVSLISYVQGALNRSPISGAIGGATQWIVPLAGDRSVRDVAVHLSVVAAPNANIHCQPCVQAQVRAHLGEMNYWSVWYDGARNWRPVMMRMRLTHPRGQTLTLTMQ